MCEMTMVCVFDINVTIEHNVKIGQISIDQGCLLRKLDNGRTTLIIISDHVCLIYVTRTETYDHVHKIIKISISVDYTVTRCSPR